MSESTEYLMACAAELAEGGFGEEANQEGGRVAGRTIAGVDRGFERPEQGSGGD